MPYVKGITYHAMDTLVERFGLSSEQALQDIAELVRGQEGVHWQPFDIGPQHTIPVPHGRLISYMGHEIVAVVVENPPGNLVVKTFLPSVVIQDDAKPKVQSPREMEAQIKALEARIASLEEDLQAAQRAKRAAEGAFLTLQNGVRSFMGSFDALKDLVSYVPGKTSGGPL